ncbi:MAG: hypothetical protein LUD72_10405 [Bacteroidales bacterium]|nr:hypothetical protein [Bacteroidales bacterium]
MICATEDIIVLNTRYDAETRREKLLPTAIRGASVYQSVAQKSAATQTGDNRSDNTVYKIRIPLAAGSAYGKTYVPEAQYADLTNDEAETHWTLQKGCYIMLRMLDSWEWDPFSFIDGETYNEDISDAQLLRRADSRYITVTEYSDDTRRGSDAVKHWRIEGR